MTYLPELLNKISTLNVRAAATLAADAVYQGTGEDVSKYGRVGVAITSDNATDGVLTMEVSHDNSTWFGPEREWADTRFGSPHMWNIVEKYFRIRYTNGTTEATNLAIQVQYSVNADVVLGHQLNEVLKQEVEAQIVRPATSFDLDAARIHLAGQRSFFFFGFNNAIATAWEDVHPGGGDIPWQTAAQSIEIVSSHAADNGTTPGLGLQSAEVHGLSATGVDQDEVILTNGTAAVAGGLTYIRINKFHSETCGTYGGSHQGDVTLRIVEGGNLAVMTGQEGSAGDSVQYGSGEAGNGYYSVPLGKVLYITQLEVIPNTDANRTMDVALYERENLLDVTTPFAPRRIIWEEIGIDKTTEKVFKSHIKIKALTDLWFRARASSGTTSKLSVSLDFYLLDENASGA